MSYRIVSIVPLAAGGKEVHTARRVFTALVATGLGLAALALAVLVGVPALALLWRQQQRQHSLRVFMAVSAIFTFVGAFFNRVCQDNYLGYVIALGILAYALPHLTEVRDTVS